MREQIQEIENELQALQNEKEEMAEIEQVESKLNKEGIKAGCDFFLKDNKYV